LALNGLWSWLFFRRRMGAAAFVEILALWAVPALTLAAFSRVDTKAAWLPAPCLAWVTFAAALCGAVWRLNPRLLG